jgi:hypothetical protein
MRTGYPVIVVVVITATDAQALVFLALKKLAVIDIGSIACMMEARNNEMKYLIAKKI